MLKSKLLPTKSCVKENGESDELKIVSIENGSLKIERITKIFLNKKRYL